MLSDILIPFVAIALAELGDKTQLSVLLLSTRTKRHVSLLFGVMLAFLLVDGFAIMVGSWVTSVIPTHILKVSSGLLFILFGLLILKDMNKEEDALESSAARGPFLSGFLMIFLAEWGDKTQIASALFATMYDAWLVLVGTLSALALLSVMAVFLGQFIVARIDKRTISKAAGTLFILMGVSFFFMI
jgi:putative Ca2+/H+ antiporter (TMEM165/GDT1 family)